MAESAPTVISQWVMGGYDLEDWRRQEALKTRFPERVRTCFGIHPWRALEMGQNELEAHFTELEKRLPAADACGETGIDMFRGKTRADLYKQCAVFERHLELNRKWCKPLVLHIVRAYAESQESLKHFENTGILHGYSGSYEEAVKYIDMGFKISVGKGIYTQGYKALKDTVKRLN